MYVRVVGERHNVLFECDKVIETETNLSFVKNDELLMEIVYADEENLHIYAMNDSGKTIDRWSIFPEERNTKK